MAVTVGTWIYLLLSVSTCVGALTTCHCSQVHQYGPDRKWLMGWLLFGQVWWENLLLFLSLYNALYSQLSLTWLFCSSPSSSLTHNMPANSHAYRVPTAVTQDRRSRKFWARPKWPVQLAKGLWPSGAVVRGLTELDLVCDYNYILMDEMLNPKI